MAAYTAAVIGTGSSMTADAAHSVGYLHAEAYRALGCEITGACARTADNARRFSDRYGVRHFGQDFRAVLCAARPDLVSVTTFARSHRAVIEAAADAGARGIWCEKPLCLTVGDAEAIERACMAARVKVIVNHQRRYLDLFRTVRKRVESGAVGRLVLIYTVGSGWDLTEWGSHWLDLFRFLAGDHHGHWALGQVRRDGAGHWYDHPRESHGLAYGALTDGTRVLLEGGEPGPGIDEAIRLIGTDGLIEIAPDGSCRLCDANGWHSIDTDSDMHWPRRRDTADDPFRMALTDLIQWIEGGPEPTTSLRNAIASTHLMLGAQASAAQGDRAELPLYVLDHTEE
jgi:predicted dehydrogenase